MSETPENLPAGTQVIAQPKLRKVDTLMVSTTDKEYIDAKTKDGLIFGGVVGGVVALTSTALLSRRMPVPAAALTGLASGLLGGLIGAATTVPSVLREAVLFLPNESPLKMSIFHVYVSCRAYNYSPGLTRAVSCNTSSHIPPTTCFSPLGVYPTLAIISDPIQPFSSPSAQQMNPDLSPQQIYSMIHRHERIRDRPLPPAPSAASLPTSSPASPAAPSQ